MDNYKESQLFILENLPETKKQELRIHEYIMTIKKYYLRYWPSFMLGMQTPKTTQNW